jgi:hypothetical protein
LSINLGASTSWNPVGLSRPVMGLLYLYCVCPKRKGVRNTIIIIIIIIIIITVTTVTKITTMDWSENGSS